MYVGVESCHRYVYLLYVRFEDKPTNFVFAGVDFLYFLVLENSPVLLNH